MNIKQAFFEGPNKPFGGSNQRWQICEIMGYLSDGANVAEAAQRHKKAFDLYLAGSLRGPQIATWIWWLNNSSF